MALSGEPGSLLSGAAIILWSRCHQWSDHEDRTWLNMADRAREPCLDSILTRISKGDRDAIGACIDTYGDLVWRLARRYLDRAEGEIEDAVQDVFVEVWLAAGKFDASRGSEAAFVATIAHRRLTDAQRRVGARGRMMKAVERRSMPTPTDSGIREPASTEVKRMESALAELPEAEREAIWMFVCIGMTHREIGIATDAPIGTVKSRLRRGLMRLASVAKQKLAQGGVG